MSKLEYLNPEDWSLHVIDGENEAVPEGWVLVPDCTTHAIKVRVGKIKKLVLYNFSVSPPLCLLDDEWVRFDEDFEKPEDFVNDGDIILWQRESKSEVVEDVVNSPSHYTSGGIECLDAMQSMLGRDEFIGFLRGNIFKYNWRYKMKNGIEDLKKAKFYQEKLIEVEGK